MTYIEWLSDYLEVTANVDAAAKGGYMQEYEENGGDELGKQLVRNFYLMDEEQVRCLVIYSCGLTTMLQNLGVDVITMMTESYTRIMEELKCTTSNK